MGKFYTPKDLKRLFGVSLSTVYKWIEEGYIKAITLPPSNPKKGRINPIYRIPEEALLEFIATNLTVGQIISLTRDKKLLIRLLSAENCKDVKEGLRLVLKSLEKARYL